jgi:simple sugar transport system ATP-binding protein
MAGIRKVYPGGVVANDDVSLAVWPGTLHAIIGENGAGKSTLVNILYGRVQPDSGRIRLRGQDVHISSPAEAIRQGIGIVSQHSSLIPALSVIDNMMLGAEGSTPIALNRDAAKSQINQIARQVGLEESLRGIDWNAPAEKLSIAAQQKVEIVKALARKAEIVILDEPTATLAPQEADALFTLLHSLVGGGSTVLFITHKLREVMAHSSAVTILRGGKTVGERLTKDTYPDDLLSLMIGQRTTMTGSSLVGVGADQPVAQVGPEAAWERGPRSEMRGAPLNAEAPDTLAPVLPTIEVRDLTVLNDRRGEAVRGVSLNVAPGELVGVAGVDGSGQRELAEAIVGLRRATGGSVWVEGKDVTGWSVERRLRAGLSFVPEDRHRDGLVLNFSIAENVLLGRQRDPYFGGGRVLNMARVEMRGEEAVKRRHIRAGGGDVPAYSLSGGNQQKVVLSRALDAEPHALVAMQPTRGLDVQATRSVYNSLHDAQAKGLAVLLFSLDLDEILEVSDRIAVMYNGGIAGILSRAEADAEKIGRLMLEGHLS